MGVTVEVLVGVLADPIGVTVAVLVGVLVEAIGVTVAVLVGVLVGCAGATQVVGPESDVGGVKRPEYTSAATIGKIWKLTLTIWAEPLKPAGSPASAACE